MRLLKRIALAFAALGFLAAGGCNAAENVNHNIRVAADSFNVYRRFTAINTINNNYLIQIEGLLSIADDEDTDVNVTIKTGKDQYMLHYVHCSTFVTYVVEQLENTSTDPYHWSIQIFGVLPSVTTDVG